MRRIYVAGAYSADNVINVFENMRKGIELSYEVLKAGFSPFCPWLDYHFSLMGEVSIEEYYRYSMAWLEVSEAVLVVPGWEDSAGTKKEMVRAHELGIPVYFSLGELIAGDVVKSDINKVTDREMI